MRTTEPTWAVASMCLALVVAIVGSACGTLAAAPATAPATQPATEPASQPATQAGGLQEYYGFGPMEILKLEWEAGDPVAVDINGDGLNDLVLINNTKSRIDLLLQKARFDPSQAGPIEIPEEDINDRFGREETWRFKRVGYDLTVGAGALVVVDLNSDRRVDLAFTSPDGLRVALQDEPPAAGPSQPAWRPAVKIDLQNIDNGPNALAAGDLDGDGRTDLAVLAGDGVFLVRQKDDGTLAPPDKLYSGAEQLQRVYVADADGDGRDDLALLCGDGEYPLRVRFQGPDGRLGPESRYKLPVPAFLEMVSLAGRAQKLALSVARQSGRLQLAALAPQRRESEPPVLTYALPATESAELRDVTLADLDGDGLTDVVVSDPASAEFLLLRADERTGLAPPSRLPGLAEMSKLVAADLDGSGRQAVVVLSAKEKTIAVSRWADGRLSFPTSLTTVGEPVAMDVADVDADAAADLVYVARDLEKKDRFWMRTLLSVGREDAHAGPELVLEGLDDKPRDLRLVDIDHDGRLDVLVLPAYGSILLVRQAEPGTFSLVAGRERQAGLVANVEPKLLSLAPLGPEGRPAALLTQKTFARAVIFNAEKGWQVVDQYHAVSDRASLACSAAFSLPGQARPVIVLYDSARGRLGFLGPEEGGTYRLQREIEVGSLPARKILLGRFGGAMDSAILLCGTRTLVLVGVDGPTRRLRQLAAYEPKIKDARLGAAAVGDVNGDGLEELVLADQGRRHVHILAFNAAGEPVTGTTFKVFEEPRSVERERFGDRGKGKEGQPRSVAVGDVTGDGKNDVILRVHDRIIVYPQD